jgi:hypothetical protein
MKKLHITNNKFEFDFTFITRMMFKLKDLNIDEITKLTIKDTNQLDNMQNKIDLIDENVFF